MAPKEAETGGVVLAYLTQQNRPYSTNDLHLNLHKEHGKAAIQKVLDSLVSEAKLKVKVNGKQTAYFVNQDLLPACNDEQLAAIDDSCSLVDEQLREAREKVKTMEAQLRQLSGSLTVSEAREQLETAEKENKELQQRVTRLEANKEVVTAAEMSAIKEAHSRTVTLWKKRKRMASDVLDSILESWPQSKKSLLEDIGIDTDESVGAILPK